MRWLACTLLVLCVPDLARADDEALANGPTYAGSLASRTSLTGNWGGLRDRWAAKGFVVALDATYTLQGVADGGLDGRVFDAISDESHTGNTFSTNLSLALDTEKARLWNGGTFDVQAEARAGRSVLQRAGTVSAVDNDALFPNVVEDFDDDTIAVTAVTLTQYLTDTIAVFGGLMNTAEGDANELAGSALSNEHFLNSALLYSLVEDASVPNVSLGGGISYEPNEALSGSFAVFGTSETAGDDPFEDRHGTTFSTEWSLRHSLADRDGGQTLGFLYGIDARRTDIAADPRTVLGAVLAGRPVPSTQADTWALYYNASQFVCGDAERGWGVFVRFGLSDGDPNVVKWNAAAGFSGSGWFGRFRDRWGAGSFYLGMSEEDLLQGLGVDDEVGGEIYYNVAVTHWLHLTADTQLVHSALPYAQDAWVVALRTHVDL